MPMAQTETESKPRGRIKRKLLALLALVLVVVGAFFLGAVWRGRGQEPVVITDLIGQRLADVQELAVVEYYYTNMGRFENQVDFYGWQVPFTTKRFIVSYDGVIKAGVNLKEMTVEVHGETITVTLPPPEILSHQIPEDSLEVFDETRNIFNPITIEDYTGFTADQRAEIEQRAIANGLLDRAGERAQAAVEELLTMLPGMDAYILQVKQAET